MIISSGQVTFHIDGRMDTDNHYYYDIRNIFVTQEINHQHSLVWKAVVENDVIWPNSSVETGENLKFLRHIMYWFSQDCSSVHFCRELRRYLDDWSADKYISRTTRFYQYD